MRLGLEHERTRVRGAGECLKAVVNEGIGGNTITRDGLTPPPTARPDWNGSIAMSSSSRRDRRRLVHGDQRHPARRDGDQVIAGLTVDHSNGQSEGIRVIGVTIIPRHNVAPRRYEHRMEPDKTQIRNEVNQWIRTKAPFDGVIDFDRVVRDPANPDLMHPPFNCGDGIHPSPVGYYADGQVGRSRSVPQFRPASLAPQDPTVLSERAEFIARACLHRSLVAPSLVL